MKGETSDPEPEGLTLLVPDIQRTAEIVRTATVSLRQASQGWSARFGDGRGLARGGAWPGAGPGQGRGQGAVTDVWRQRRVLGRLVERLCDSGAVTKLTLCK